MAQPTLSRWNRGAVAAKIETTYGVDVSPVAADVVFARNIAFRVTQQTVPDARIGGLIAQLPNIPGARSATLSFEVFLKGAGVAYSASVKPEVDALLRALGFAAAGSFVLNLEKWTYTPQSGATLGESVTAKLIVENAPSGTLLGSFGTGRILHRAGEPAVLAVTLTGKYAAPADVTMITGTLPTVQPPVFKSAAVTIDAVTHKVSAIELDLGSELQVLQDANDAQATGDVLLVGRRVTATMDPQAVATATYDFHAKRDAGTLVAASWQVGTTQYNRVKLSGPKMQIVDLAEQQRMGVRTYQLTTLFSPSVGSDELSIVFD